MISVMVGSRPLLYFHAPCFDGLVSAAIAWTFLETRRDWRNVRLRGVDYRVSSRWLRLPAKEPFAVVDFLYHPRAALWVDHHQTTFLTAELERRFKRGHPLDHVYDKRAPACAELLWRRMRTALGPTQAHFAEMVEWATKIDSASYHSVDEALGASTPAQAISLALSQFSNPRECEPLVAWFREFSLEEIAARPEIRDPASRARSLLFGGLRRVERAAHLQDSIVVFDVDANGAMVSRFAPYRFYPEARYSAGIVRSGELTKITAMRNPWLSFNSAPLGAIFRRIGGGGHQRVGSVVLNAKDARRAPEILESVISAIRHHDQHRSRPHA